MVARFCPLCGGATDDRSCPQHDLVTIDVAALQKSDGQLALGAVVDGRYKIVSELGSGAFGRVYSAISQRTGHSVAIKVLKLDGGVVDETIVRRFCREALLASSLQHPNIVRVFDLAQTEGGTLYLAMEMINGRTLREILKDLAKRHTCMTEADATELGVVLLRALSEVHATGIVHRDLKPENIMYAELPGGKPIPKVLDFGIARLNGSSLTRTEMVGTASYMSPEQVHPDGRVIDARSDLYAVGSILFECVTGRTPFVGETPWSVMFQRTQIAAPSVADFSDVTLSAAFVRCVAQSLATDPARRFGDAKSMCDALESGREAMATAAETVGAVPRRGSDSLPRTYREPSRPISSEWTESQARGPSASSEFGQDRGPPGTSVVASGWWRDRKRAIYVAIAAAAAGAVAVALATQAPRSRPPADQLAEFRLATQRPQTSGSTSGGVGQMISRCFHPTGKYVSSEIGKPYQRGENTALDGFIEFRGMLTGAPYRMDFTLETRQSAEDRQIKVFVTGDSAVAPPNPNCRLLNWTKLED